MKIKSPIINETGLNPVGYEIVPDITARDAIPTENRVDGLGVFVLSTKEEFRLIGGVSNVNWQNITGLAEYIGEFNDFSSLPSAASNSGKYAIVLNSTGVWLVNRREQGWYRSDGANWIRMRDYKLAKDISFISLSDLSKLNVRDAIDETYLMEAYTLSVARNGSISSAQDLRRQNGTSTSRCPYIIPFNSKIHAAAANTDVTGSIETWDMVVYVNNVEQYRLNIVNAIKAYDANVAVSLNPGDEIRIRAENMSSSISYPGATLFIRRRP